MFCCHTRLGALTLLLLPALASATPGDVWVVDAAGGADFTEVSQAIAAATDGDVVLVLPGDYGPFAIDGTSLTVHADVPDFTTINGTARIRNVGSGQHVQVDGLWLRSGLRLNDCQGHVGFSDCRLEGTTVVGYSPPMSEAHQVVGCEDVVFTRSKITGRWGDFDFGDFDCFIANGYPGETALRVTDSSVAFYSCDIEGGTGGCGFDGPCGFFEPCAIGSPGPGGSGVKLTFDSTILVDDTLCAGGLGGYYDTKCGPGGMAPAGVAYEVQPGSSVLLASDPIVSLVSRTSVMDGTPLSVELGGPVGAEAFLLWSDRPDRRPFPLTIGILHVEGQGLGITTLGTIPGGGTLEASFTPPPIAAGMDARRLQVQAFALAPGVGRFLGTTTGLVVLDPAF